METPDELKRIILFLFAVGLTTLILAWSLMSCAAQRDIVRYNKIHNAKFR